MTLAVRPRQRRRPAARRAALAPWMLLVPAGIVLLGMTAWPLIQLGIMSFQEFGRAQIFGAAPEWIGLGNYTRILADNEFWIVLGRSIAFCLVNVVLTMTLGVAIAALMTRLGRVMKGLVSIGLLLAWAMPPLTATVVWGWMFDTDRGVVNWVLTQAGFDFAGHSWLIDPLSFFFVATIIITWQSIPFVAFTSYAALTQVPSEVLEAASLDGASAWQRFTGVVFPYVRPVLLVLVLLQIIWDMRVFPQIKALQTIGGIKADTQTIGVYIYNVSIAGGDLGTGGAIAVILVIVMLAISAYYIRSTLKADES